VSCYKNNFLFKNNLFVRSDRSSVPFLILPAAISALVLLNNINLTSNEQSIRYYSTTPQVSSNNPIPEKTYSNADAMKKQILGDNIEKSGIYR